MKQARFTKHARSELLGQTAYYEAVEQGLGARFRSEVEAAQPSERQPTRCMANPQQQEHAADL